MEKFIHDENITIKKDLPQLPRQALTGTLQFRAVRNRPVDRQRPIDRTPSFPDVKAAGFDRSGKSLA